MEDLLDGSPFGVRNLLSEIRRKYFGLLIKFSDRFSISIVTIKGDTDFLMEKYLFNQLNGCLKVHAKVYKDPLNTFTFVLFLLENKHVMVKELLQSFVCEINAKLFESIKLSFTNVYPVNPSHKCFQTFLHCDGARRYQQGYANPF